MKALRIGIMKMEGVWGRGGHTVEVLLILIVGCGGHRATGGRGDEMARTLGGVKVRIMVEVTIYSSRIVGKHHS